MLLSPAQIYAYARGAGFTGGAAVEATAVALAESSGETTATSTNPDGGTNVGLMQLDTPGGKGAGYSVAQLQDPATNMAVAYKGWVADGHTFTKHWETANNGAAASHLAEAQKAAGTGFNLGDFFKGVTDQATSPPSNIPVPNPLALTEQAGKVLTWLTTPANWGRVALVVVGGAVVLVGLAKIASPVTAPAARAARELAGPNKLALGKPKEVEPAPRPKPAAAPKAAKAPTEKAPAAKKAPAKKAPAKKAAPAAEKKEQSNAA